MSTKQLQCLERLQKRLYSPLQWFNKKLCPRSSRRDSKTLGIGSAVSISSFVDPQDSTARKSRLNGQVSQFSSTNENNQSTIGVPHEMLPPKKSSQSILTVGSHDAKLKSTLQSSGQQQLFMATTSGHIFNQHSNDSSPIEAGSVQFGNPMTKNSHYQLNSSSVKTYQSKQ